MYRVGKIINTHGLNGEVKVLQITDFAEVFDVDKSVYAELNGQITELVIDGYRLHKQYHLLRFKGFDSINDVEHLKGVELNIKEDQLPELGEREFYYHDIIGCHVHAVDGEKIGKIESILSPGANDVWVVKNEDRKEFLIPYIEDVVKEVDIDNKKVIIELMEGLL